MITKRKIKIPIFRVNLLIVVLDDLKEATQIDSRVKTDCDSCVVDYNNGNVTIFIKPDNICTLAHECLHVKNAVWERIGYIPQSNNDEVDAYLLDYIIKEVNKVIIKHNAK